MPVERLTPVFIDAPPLEGIGPPVEATLWRYMDLPQPPPFAKRAAAQAHAADTPEARRPEPDPEAGVAMIPALTKALQVLKK